MKPSNLPQDPMIRQLVQSARASQLTRRGVLAGAGAGAVAMALAACSTGGASSQPTPAKDQSSSDKTLTWANWQAYLDQDSAGKYPTLEAFQKQSGIQVKYDVAVDDNNTYYAKVKDQLKLGKDIGADTVCLTDWMIARWIRLGYVQPFDDSAIPNRKNLVSNLKDVDFDPGRKKSLPWQSGFAGICWNKEKLPKGLKSVDDLWSSELKGKVGVLSEMRDTMGLLMLQQGVDVSKTFSDSDFNKAVDTLTKHVSDGQIRNIKGNSYLNDLKSGDTLAAICWSGDITQLNAEAGDNWEFIIPEAGGLLWSDNFVIPVGSPRKANAEKLIDYYYEPEVAAEVAAWVNYITPVQGAKEAAVKIDPKLADNQLIFPDSETLSKVKVFRTLSPAEEQKYQAAFQKVILGA